MFKKTIAAVMVFCLLGQNFAFAVPNPQEKEKIPSLSKLQAQAQADWAALRAKYGTEAQNLLTPLMAAATPLLAKVNTLEAAEETITLLQEEKTALMEEIEQLKRQLAHRTGSLQEANANIQRLEMRLSKVSYQNSELQKQVAALKETPLRTIAKKAGEKMSPEEIWALREELSHTYSVFRDVAGEPSLFTKLAEENSGFWRIFEDGMFSEARFADLMKSATPEAREELQIVSQVLKRDPEKFLVKNLSQLHKEEAGYTAKFVQRAMPLLEQTYRETTSVSTRSLIRLISKRILSKSSLLGIGLLTIGCVTLFSEQSANAQVAVAERIAQNPELFINAEDLTAIENNELAANTAREIAQVLHIANELSKEDMDFVRENYQQQEQGRLVKKSITSSLRTVSAH